MKEPDFNFIPVLIASLIPMIMGFIYYHPSIAGSAWMKANGFTKESIGKGPKPIMFLVAFIMSFLLSIFMWSNVTGAGGMDPNQVVDPNDGHSYVTFGHGVAHGIIFSITALLPIFVTMSIFEKRGWLWTFVNLGYWGITVILMGGLLSAWR